MDKRIRNLTNCKFGKLLVLKLIGRDLRRNTTWKCRCDCGKEMIVSSPLLTMGRKKSCGCLYNDSIKFRKNYHGQTGTSLHNMWLHMRQRCNDKNCTPYKNYGGRGIIYDLRWENFNNFFNDMNSKYLEVKNKFDSIILLSLERINVNGNYNKENCTFIPKSQQSKNRRCNNRIFIGISPIGVKHIGRNKSEFEKNFNLYYGTISGQLNGKTKKLRNGWKFNYL